MGRQVDGSALQVRRTSCRGEAARMIPRRQRHVFPGAAVPRQEFTSPAIDGRRKSIHGKRFVAKQRRAPRGEQCAGLFGGRRRHPSSDFSGASDWQLASNAGDVVRAGVSGAGAIAADAVAVATVDLDALSPRLAPRQHSDGCFGEWRPGRGGRGGAGPVDCSRCSSRHWQPCSLPDHPPRRDAAASLCKSTIDGLTPGGSADP